MFARRVFPLLIVASLTPPAVAQTKASDSAAYFRTRCLSCHQPPDVNLGVDRAWLDQVHRTA